MTTQFPPAIRAAILEAAQAAPGPFGANFIHTDEGQPTASLGRLSGGIPSLEVWDDLCVFADGNAWTVCDDHGEPLGSYGDASALRAGLAEFIAAQHAQRVSLAEPRTSRRAMDIPGGEIRRSSGSSAGDRSGGRVPT